MTTARQIITGALTFHLNRLSPGETLNDDDAAVCLTALNHIADEWNGVKSFLFREILTTSAAITGTTGTLGATWAGLAPGDEILGATVRDGGGADQPINPGTLDQYAAIPLKTSAGSPVQYFHDGLATVYFYPACTGQTVTLRTRQVLADFADLDTDYSMPKGYKSALSACLAAAVGGVMVAQVSPAVYAAARAARLRIQTQAVNPGIIGGVSRRGTILDGWQ